jgi:hypothetical protein
MVPLPERHPAGDDHVKLTGVGCVLTLLTVAVILGVALPIAHWRDPETGQPVPRTVAIFAPFLIGAAFHGIAAGLLRLVGLRTWSKSEKDGSVPPVSKEEEEEDKAQSLQSFFLESNIDHNVAEATCSPVLAPCSQQEYLSCAPGPPSPPSGPLSNPSKVGICCQPRRWICQTSTGCSCNWRRSSR